MSAPEKFRCLTNPVSGTGDDSLSSPRPAYCLDSEDGAAEAHQC